MIRDLFWLLIDLWCAELMIPTPRPIKIWYIRESINSKPYDSCVYWRYFFAKCYAKEFQL